MSLKTISTYLLFSLTMVLFTTCSSQYYQQSESIHSKMQRFKARNQNQNTVPKFEVQQQYLAKGLNSNYKSSNRAPASVGAQKKSIILPQNNKKFYFLGLLGQYYRLSNYLPKTKAYPEINSCPHFHSELLEQNKYFQQLRSVKAPLRTDYQLLSIAHYPELALPLSEGERSPRVLDLLKEPKKNFAHTNKKGLVEKALGIHLGKTYKELSRLCETGNSNNYYHYENLLGHLQRTEKTSSYKMKMDHLLKTTLYSNLFLLKSLSGHERKKSLRAPASANRSVQLLKLQYDHALMERLNANWSEAYLNQLGQ